MAATATLGPRGADGPASRERMMPALGPGLSGSTDRGASCCALTVTSAAVSLPAKLTPRRHGSFFVEAGANPPWPIS